MLGTLVHILFQVLLIYCGFSVLYLFFFAAAGKFFYRKRTGSLSAPGKRIAILVPAYKEDNIILSTAHHLLRLDYPSSLFDVYILADSFREETLVQLQQLSLQVMEVHFEKSTKTKSLNEAFRRIDKSYDIALICDADNILARDFLQQVNTAFVKGAKAVQGRRVAKNLDTPFAVLDACSEGINNHIFRKGANAAGLSSAVIGSGMAFEFENIKNILAGIQAVGGFDKILQLKIVEQGVKIQYLEGALVFDEKVDSSEAFTQQRKRWVSSQFIYLKQFFLPALRELFKGNLSYFNLAIAANLVLPRAFLLALLPLLLVVDLVFIRVWTGFLVAVCLVYFMTLVIALPAELVNKKLFRAVLQLPGAVGLMLGTVFQIKKANKTFIHTVHTKTEVSNSLFNDHGN